jgi:hypothetical protein
VQAEQRSRERIARELRRGDRSLGNFVHRPNRRDGKRAVEPANLSRTVLTSEAGSLLALMMSVMLRRIAGRPMPLCERAIELRLYLGSDAVVPNVADDADHSDPGRSAWPCRIRRPGVSAGPVLLRHRLN